MAENSLVTLLFTFLFFFFIFSVGKYSYASDLRFNCKHMEGSDDWSLEISYPQKTDAGVYECQVMKQEQLFCCFLK